MSNLISFQKIAIDLKTSVLISYFVVIFVVCNGITPINSRVKKLDNPYVTLFANDLHRGKQHVEFIRGGCKNLPDDYINWASSIDTHNRCVDVCDQKDCEGTCVRIYPASATNVDLGLKLELAEMNDRIQSLKSCYTFVRKSNSKPKRS